MTAYVVDASAAVRLADAEFALAAGDTLLAPTLLRSQTLSLLRGEVDAGVRDDPSALAALARVDALPIRLLGDRVLRRTAWRIAAELGHPDTYAAEYIALARLHGDALVTEKPESYPAAPLRLLSCGELLH